MVAALQYVASHFVHVKSDLVNLACLKAPLHEVQKPM